MGGNEAESPSPVRATQPECLNHGLVPVEEERRGAHRSPLPPSRNNMGAVTIRSMTDGEETQPPNNGPLVLQYATPARTPPRPLLESAIRITLFHFALMCLAGVATLFGLPLALYCLCITTFPAIILLWFANDSLTPIGAWLAILGNSLFWGATWAAIACWRDPRPPGEWFAMWKPRTFVRCALLLSLLHVLSVRFIMETAFRNFERLGSFYHLNPDAAPWLLNVLLIWTWPVSHLARRWGNTIEFYGGFSLVVANSLLWGFTLTSLIYGLRWLLRRRKGAA